MRRHYEEFIRKIARHPDLRAQSVLNDVLGLRLIVEEYPEKYPDYFRVVDMRNGKAKDDGYRAIHLYYKRDNFSYPIEIQIWSKYDSVFNGYMHRNGYKTVLSEILLKLREEYDRGNILNFEDYERRLYEYEL